MKFSLHSVHGGVKNIDEIHRRVRRAEELGYDGIFLGESQLSSIDSFQTLASCAMITTRVLLGIAVTNLVFRHPTVIAGAAASLKLFAYSCIGLALFVPWGVAEAGTPLAILFAIPMLAVKLAVGGMLLALIETVNAKMRLFRVPEFLATAFLLAVIALLVHVLLGA